MRNDLVERKIKSSRKSSKKFLEFKKTLGLDPDVVTSDEQDIMSALQVVFEGETILTQYRIKKKKLDAYFFPFFFFLDLGFLSVAYLTVPNLARLGISVHC